MTACAPTLLRSLALVLSSLSPLAVGCGRLPALAIGGRMQVVTHEHAAAQSLALIVGCGFALERETVVRAEPSELPPGVPAEVDVQATRCTDATLCRWQQGAELGAAQVLLPLAEEERP